MSENQEQQKNTGETVFCTHCGKKISATAKFCPFCGAENLSRKSEPETAEQKQEPEQEAPKQETPEQETKAEPEAAQKPVPAPGPKKKGNGIVLQSSAPIGDGGRKFDVCYLIFVAFFVILFMVLSSKNRILGVLLGTALGFLIGWLIKNQIVYFPLMNLRSKQYHCDTKLPYDQLIQKLQPILLPMGMTIEKNKNGQPVISYDKMMFDVSYNENDTFSIWWHESVGRALLRDRQYIPEYRTSCVAYGIIGYYVQQVLSETPQSAAAADQGKVPVRKHNTPVFAILGIFVAAAAVLSLIFPGSNEESTESATTEETATETTTASVNKDATADDVVGTWTISSFIHDGVELSGDQVDSDLELMMDTDGNFECRSEELDEDIIGTYTLTDGVIAMDSTELSDTTFSVLEDGTLLMVVDEAPDDRYFLTKTSDSTDITAVASTEETSESTAEETTENAAFTGLDDEFADHTDLVGTYGVLGYIADPSDGQIMPLEGLERAAKNMTEEGLADLDNLENASLTISKDEQFTMLDANGETSTGSLIFNDGRVLLDNGVELVLQDDGSLEQDDGDRTIVWMDTDEIDAAMDELMNGSSEDTETSEADDSEYIIPNSDSEYIDASYVDGWTVDEINMAINEIYARHGREFNTQEIQDYFDAQSWYTPQYSPEDFDAISDSLLNDYEKANIKTLAAARDAASGSSSSTSSGYSDDELGQMCANYYYAQTGVQADSYSLYLTDGEAITIDLYDADGNYLVTYYIDREGQGVDATNGVGNIDFTQYY